MTKTPPPSLYIFLSSTRPLFQPDAKKKCFLITEICAVKNTNPPVKDSEGSWSLHKLSTFKCNATNWK